MSTKKHSFENSQIKVDFDGSICAHAGICFRELKSVFDGDANPPINLSGAPIDKIISVVEKCPSSALRYQRLDGEKQESAQESAIATIIPGGPLALRGILEWNDAKWTRLTLCRCGYSNNKPFCDGSHNKHTFDDGKIAEPEFSSSSDAENVITIKAIANGPMIIKGDLTFKTADGKTAGRREKCGVCRCGKSKNKPYCDGSHKAFGFSTE